MDFKIVSDKREVARLAVKDDPETHKIDCLDAAEAYMWLDQALRTREGIAQVLRYIFCKLHKNIQNGR